MQSAFTCACKTLVGQTLRPNEKCMITRPELLSRHSCTNKDVACEIVYCPAQRCIQVCQHLHPLIQAERSGVLCILPGSARLGSRQGTSRSILIISAHQSSVVVLVQTPRQHSVCFRLWPSKHGTIASSVCAPGRRCGLRLTSWHVYGGVQTRSRHQSDSFADPPAFQRKTRNSKSETDGTSGG